MSREYTDVDDLAVQMIEDPGFYGIELWRQNPCCMRDRLRVQFSERQLRRSWEDAEEAGVYLKALARVMDEYQARFRLNPNDPSIETVEYPCGGCVMEGDVEEAWLTLHGETIEALQAGLIR